MTAEKNRRKAGGNALFFFATIHPQPSQSMNFDNDFSVPIGTAREKVQQAISTARERTNDALVRGEQCVRERPGAVVLAAFGLGLAVGVALAVATRPAPRRPTLADSLGDSRERLAELFGTVAANLGDPLRKTYASVSGKASSLGDSVAEVLEKVSHGRKLPWR
jgi:hypothetical protein